QHAPWGQWRARADAAPASRGGYRPCVRHRSRSPLPWRGSVPPGPLYGDMCEERAGGGQHVTHCCTGPSCPRTVPDPSPPQHTPGAGLHLPPGHVEVLRQEVEYALQAHRRPGLPAPTRLREGVAARLVRAGHGCGRVRRQRGIGPLGVPVLGVRHHRAAGIAAQRGIAEGASLCITSGIAPSSSPMGLVSDTTATIIVHAGPVVVVMHFLHADRKRATLPDMEESLTTINCIT